MPITSILSSPAFEATKNQIQNVLELNQNTIVGADAQARTEARESTLWGVGVTLFAVTLGLGLAWRNIGALMMPLVSLTRQAEQIGAGRYNQRIEVRRDDEIGLLARTFNEMAERLQETRQPRGRTLAAGRAPERGGYWQFIRPGCSDRCRGYGCRFEPRGGRTVRPGNRCARKLARDVVREAQLATAIERAVRRESEAQADAGETAFITLGEGTGSRVYRPRVTAMRRSADEHLGAVAVLEDVTYLQEVDRLKTEFIGVASHELRTPVTSLLLGVQLLQEGAAGPLTVEQREVADALRQDLDRLERMMTDLLDLTRLEAGHDPAALRGRFSGRPPPASGGSGSRPGSRQKD